MNPFIVRCKWFPLRQSVFRLVIKMSDEGGRLSWELVQARNVFSVSQKKKEAHK